MGKQNNPSILNYYDFGKTTVFACKSDPRFSWCAYIPKNYDDQGSQTYRLLVSVHGTLRDMAEYRDVFVEFADAHNVIILSPLFPANMPSHNDLSAYKFIDVGGVRYDEILLSMVDEVAEKYRLSSDKFSMFGFSGGGHFTHRFLYLHPERLAAVSIGAPGVVTLLNDEHDFWVGTANFGSLFGRAVNIEQMRQVAVQMIVGGDDVETWEITIDPNSDFWMQGADLASGNRQERILKLKQSFEQNGIRVQHDVVPNVAHQHGPLMPRVISFFEEVVRTRWV